MRHLSAEVLTSAAGEATVITGNIQGLYTRRNKHKIDVLGDLARKSNAIVIALTETHLRKEVADAEVYIKGFHLIRQDRSQERVRGGVAIYLREDFVGEMKIISTGSTGVVEWLAVYLEKKKMVLGCMYRPPSCNQIDFRSALENLEKTLDELGSPSPIVLLCGDLNLPIIKWVEHGNIEGGSETMKIQAEMLKRFMRRLFLEQMVHVNTRQNNILDLVLTNNQDYIQEISVRDTALSDHRLLEIGVQPFQTIANQNRPNAVGNDLSRLNFRHKSVNWDQISAEYAEVPWYSVLQDLSVEEMYSSLCQKITEVC